MGRRKKEPPEAHRAAISIAAQRLFEKKGILSSTMDDVAREAGYSKATLYVYFQNKQELVGFLALESMKKLREYLQGALAQHTQAAARYQSICAALVRYRDEYPFYFDMALDTIPFIQEPSTPAAIKEAYTVGEQLNAEITRFFKDGMETGELRQNPEPLTAAFTFWGALSGLIKMAAAKEAYLEKGLGLPRAAFLQAGFDTLYRAIANENAPDEPV